MNYITSNQFDVIVPELRRRLIESEIIDTGEWQSVRDIPQALMAEVQDVSFAFQIPLTVSDLQILVKPNLPWAEDHFGERVSGEPFNPPPSEAWWPFAVRSNELHKKDKKFSHTYPERLWPRYAGAVEDQRRHDTPLRGIRFEYGDLGNVVDMLRKRRSTRQAYVPIWFPEDTGAVHGERVPCTLGYHLMIRDNQLKIVYYIRSCDFLRHFRDDVYMACRLNQWMCNMLDNVEPGQFVMHISSLHVFASDVRRLIHVQQHG